MHWALLPTLLISLFAQAQVLTPAELKTGDILLQSVPCYLCQLIEIEEGLPYSHTGVVLMEKGNVFVLESWNNVQKLSLDQHLALRKGGSKTLVLRALDTNGNELSISAPLLENTFEQSFVGHHYDSDYSWINQDEVGERYYCSEMTAKLLNPFLPVPFSTKPMHFLKYRDTWIRYFHGNPPDGAPGISPADFARSPLLRKVGEL